MASTTLNRRVVRPTSVGIAFWMSSLVASVAMVQPVAAQPQVTITSLGDSLTRDTITFEGRDVKQMAEVATLRVPFVRGNAASPRFALRWVRFASTAAAPHAPIVFLAGGPGDAGTRAIATMPKPILDSLRAVGDVIAFDQRGTGRSEPRMDCQTSSANPTDKTKIHLLPMDRAPTSAERVAVANAQARACLSGIQARNIPFDAFTTTESANDLEALRIALGVEQLSFLGGSYGTHLGLAYLRRFSTRASRTVLIGVEGPDDTFKLPSNVDAAFVRIAALAAADSAFRDRESLLVVFDRLITQLTAKPVLVGYEGAAVVITPWDLQEFVTGTLGDLRSILALPKALYAMDDGDAREIIIATIRARRGRPMNAMNLLTNCASGASEKRRAQIAFEARTARLGNVIDYPASVVCLQPELVMLPNDFRKPFDSQASVLFVTGTLDGRTPGTNVDALLPHFPNGRHLVIENQSHSLMGDGAVFQATLQFLRGIDVPSNRIARPAPRFTP